jgi:hypothetical protein
MLPYLLVGFVFGYGRFFVPISLPKKDFVSGLFSGC